MIPPPVRGSDPARVLVPISRATRAKLEAYCALYRLADVDAIADRILNDGLNDLAHEDLTTVGPMPSLGAAAGGGIP